MNLMTPLIQGLKVLSLVNEEQEFLFDQGSVDFLVALHEEFNHRRLQLLQERKNRQGIFDKGIMPYMSEKKNTRGETDWKINPLPTALLKRKVEITGPADAKMIINALNSGADVFMADLEDSCSPTWDNIIQGQLNLYRAVRKSLTYQNLSGKSYSLNDQTAVLMVRPRGWHLEEKSMLIGKERASASLLDFGLFFYHNAWALMETGSGPFFYLPKIESCQEAKLWNDVFVFAEEYLNIPRGTIKATVLIETITAAFEMDEILYELREHSAGLNCGRWDYIFSFIKKFRNLPEFVLPDRAQVTMESHFMDSYSKLLIKTCHHRGAPAIGGMSAFIPIKNNEEQNLEAIQKVKKDKLREVQNGHDGTWVAHPGLVAPAREVFDSVLKEDNQISKQLTDLQITAEDLLKVPTGSITETGLRTNINVGILYMASWLRGTGAAALYNLMEDAATAEISRAQVWQWLRHKAKLKDGREITAELVNLILNEEVLKIKRLPEIQSLAEHRIDDATRLFYNLIHTSEFAEFLTIKAYPHIN
jgi:malate synthase